MKILIRTLALFLTVIFMITGCDNGEEVDSEYLASIEAWHHKRIENLKSETGWLNLVGLYWLSEGENTFGSADNNKLIFPPKAPAYLGSFFLEDSSVWVRINPEYEVLHDGQPVMELELKPDVSGNPTVLEYKSLRWFLIKRGEQYGIRLRDLDAPLVKNFEGIDRFPVHEKWKVEATFEKYDPPKEMDIPTVLGTVEEEKSPGKLKFNINGKSYTIDAIDAGKKLFLIFGDETNGEETYGAGRFLYVDKPDSTNKVIVDFNKAYNPPCAFTKFATCPLPPKQNNLHLEITAGEKTYGHGH